MSVVFLPVIAWHARSLALDDSSLEKDSAAGRCRLNIAVVKPCKPGLDCNRRTRALESL